MRVVLAYRVFASFAGSELYLLTVAEQLEQLGHEAIIHTQERGPVAELAEEKGFPVLAADDLPDDCDALLVQDAELPYLLAERYPQAPMVYVAHSTEFVAQRPPLADGMLDAVVVMNDRVGRRIAAGPGTAELVRLHQPIDLLRFSRHGRIASSPERVLVFGNDHRGEQLARIRRACAAVGLEVDVLGGTGPVTGTPEAAIARSDIVIGIGRCVLEGMTARKAAYVSGVVGTDGWVTRESYPAIEADGFSGRATGLILDEQRLRTDLAAWRPELAEQGKDLAFANHDAAVHAEQLVELWRRLGRQDGRAPLAGAAELARLARVNAQIENRALANAAEAARQRANAEGLRKELDDLRETRRYRLGTALVKPWDRLRELAGRRNPHH